MATNNLNFIVNVRIFITSAKNIPINVITIVNIYPMGIAKINFKNYKKNYYHNQLNLY